MRDRRQLLKIKLKSLAAEAKIIRQAERKLALPRVVNTENGQVVIPNKFTKSDRDANPEGVKVAAQNLRQMVRMRRAKMRGEPWYDQNRAELREIRDHRVLNLRQEARATHLAYGFLRGRTYAQMEGNRLPVPKDTFAFLAEKKLLDRAAKMAAAYGGGIKCDTERDLKDWVQQRYVRLTFSETADGGTVQGLLPPPAILFDGSTPAQLGDDDLPF